MSQQIAELYAKITADTSGLEKGLAGTKSALTKTAGNMKGLQGGFKELFATLPPGIQSTLTLTGAISAAAYAAREAINTTVDYAASVRDLSNVTGMTAEETSRLIQVSDDHKISVEALTMAQRKLSAEGKSLSAGTLAQLADDYNALGSAAAKSQFLIQKFGKSGFQFAELLAMGGANIKAEWAGVSGALVLDQAALDSAREYEKALDGAMDAMDAVKVMGGKALLPVVTREMENLSGLIGLLSGDLKIVNVELFKSADTWIEWELAAKNAVTEIQSTINEQGIDTRNLIDWSEISARTDWAGALGLAEGMQQEAERFSEEKEKLLAQKAELDAQFANNPGAKKYKDEL
jgi:hypothetical protein